MKSLPALILTVAAAGLSVGAAAAPEISGAVSIRNNKASNIVVGGGNLDIGKIAGLKGANLSLQSAANVNSLVMYDPNSRVSGVVSIQGNDAKDVFAIGGTANVNSVVMGQPTPAQ
jgi:hypothetical protein